MKKKLFFIFNPKSGKGLIKAHLFEIVDTFTAYGYEVMVHPTQNAEEAYTETKQMAGQVDLIVCSGGDGTLDEVVKGVMDSGIEKPIGYIPSGSTNDFATSLAIPKNMEKAALNIMTGKPYGCDIGRFNEDTFVYIAAFGLFTDVSYLTDQNLKNMLGHMAYILEGAKKIFDMKSYHLEVEVDGTVTEGDYIYGMITNSRSVGGFKNITGKNVEMDDGLFEVTLIHMPKNPLELNEIVTALIMSIDNTDLIDSFKTSRIVIRSQDALAWTLDGEFGGDHKVACIENKKQALQIYLNPEESKEIPIEMEKGQDNE